MSESSGIQPHPTYSIVYLHRSSPYTPSSLAHPITTFFRSYTGVGGCKLFAVNLISDLLGFKMFGEPHIYMFIGIIKFKSFVHLERDAR